MIAAYLADTDRLGLGRPDHEPKATETIEPIVALIGDLVDSGHAYESGGDVYFRVRSYPAYGALSNRDPDEMDQGEEAGTHELKEDPLDFALWKARKEGEDTAWPSPWGEGRPGWHIECSAMAEELLGLEFAIHGGGSDLVFPHHENEAAQTEAARGRPLARMWMHNGMVETGPEEKMAKSVGNIFLLGEALDAYGPEAVVAFLISGPLPAAAAVQRRGARAGRRPQRAVPGLLPIRGGRRKTTARSMTSSRSGARRSSRRWPTTSTPPGRWRRSTSSSPRVIAGRSPGAHDAVAELLEIVGLGSLAEPGRGRGAPTRRRRRCSPQRQSARAERDFERADAIRDELAALGWEVRDGADGARLVTARLTMSAIVPRCRLRAQPGCRGASRPPPGAARVDGRGGRQRASCERLCGSPDHQGVVAEVEPYPYADAESLLARRATRSCWRSTRCRTRTTSGRSAGPRRQRAPPAS